MSVEEKLSNVLNMKVRMSDNYYIDSSWIPTLSSLSQHNGRKKEEY
jgi:hypothetical protein